MKKYTPSSSDIGKEQESQIALLQSDLKNARLRAKNYEEVYRKLRKDLDQVNADKASLIKETQELASMLE